MGEITQKTCDIFGTVQRKGVRHIHVEVTDLDHDDSTSDSGKTVLLAAIIECGELGLKRLLRKLEAGTTPPKPKPREPAK